MYYKKTKRGEELIDTELILAILYGIGVTITNIVTLIKNAKNNKTIKTQDEQISFNKVLNNLPKNINNAEELVGEKKGALKKTIVLQNAQIECKNAGCGYQSETLDKKIEEILTTPTKKENENGKKEDKINEEN